MKKINLIEWLSRNSHEKQKPQRFARYAVMLIMLLTLGVGQMWGAAKQRYIYCGISDNFDTYKDGSNWGFNFWGGTSEGVKTPTYIANWDHDGRTYHVYRVQVYDDNNKAQFKGNKDWWVPDGGYSVTLNGTTNNAVFFSSSSDGWDGQFQENYQVTSTASLAATSTNIAVGSTSTLTPSLSSNSTYNDIKSTSYSVTTNPGGTGSVTSAGVFSATAAGTYTVTATVTYNAKDFSDITKTTTATKTITVYAPITLNLNGGGNQAGQTATTSINAIKGNTATSIAVAKLPVKSGNGFDGYWTGSGGTGTQVINERGAWISGVSGYTDGSGNWICTTGSTLYARWRATGYYVVGQFNSWKAESSNRIDDETNKASVTISKSPFASSDYIAKFKIRQINATPNTDVWYGYGTGGTYTTIGKANPNSATLQTGDKNEIKLQVYYDGDYEFTWDGSTPKVSVQVPVIEQVQIYKPDESARKGSYDWTGTPATYKRSVTIALDRSTTYEFKAVADSKFFSKTPQATIDRDHTTVTGITSGDAPNTRITTDIAGNYTFVLDTTPSSENISVTFPTRRRVTYTIVTIDGGTGTAGSLTATNDDDGNVNISTLDRYVADGNHVTFTAPTEATGYTWRGWYSTNTPSAADWSSGRLSSNKTYSGVSVSGGDLTVYAVYSQNKYDVSVSAGSHGSVSPSGTVAVKQVTGTSITATPSTNYLFSDWTISGGGITPTTSSTNPQTFKATTTGGTIQANFHSKWTVAGSMYNNFDWSKNSNLLDGYTTIDGKVIATVTITLAANTTYTFKVKDRSQNQDNGWYGIASGSTATYTYADDNTYKAITTASGNQNISLTTAAAGDYVFRFNLTDKKVAVDFPTSHLITSGVKTVYSPDHSETSDASETGGTYTAVDNASNNVKGANKYVAASASVTFTAEAKAGYEFDGWYTNAECTTGKDMTNPLTVSSIGANVTRYAKFKEIMTKVNAYMLLGGVSIDGGEYEREQTIYVGVHTTHTVTAKADAAYYFKGWKLYPLYEEDELNFAISGDKDDEDNYSVTVRGLGAAGTGRTQMLDGLYGTLERIYFRNKFDNGSTVTHWDNVYVYYDVTQNGSGQVVTSRKNNDSVLHVAMTAMGYYDIYYATVPRHITRYNKSKVAFADFDISGNEYTFYNAGGGTGKAVYRDDYKTKNNMFVPYHVASATNSNYVDYFNNGYWIFYANSLEEGLPAGYYIERRTGDNTYSGRATDCEFRVLEDVWTAHPKIQFSLRIDGLEKDKYVIFNEAGKKYRLAGANKDATSIRYNNCTDLEMIEDNDNDEYFILTPTAEGEYVITLEQGSDRMKISVEYPVVTGDYVIENAFNDGSAKTTRSNVIKASKAGTKTRYSMYLNNAGSGTLKLRKCTSIDGSGNPVWSTGDNTNLQPILNDAKFTKGVYQFDITISDDQVETIDSVRLYTGDFYIKTDAAPGGWVAYKKNILDKNTVNFDRTSATYDNYFCKYFSSKDCNIKSVIANDYCNQLSDTVKLDGIARDVDGEPFVPVDGTSIRFSYNSATNETKRAYLGASLDNEYMNIMPYASGMIYNTAATPVDLYGTTADQRRFSDLGNWVYEINVKVKPGGKAGVQSAFTDAVPTKHYQTLIPNDNVVLGGSSSNMYTIRVVYDFKTNFMMSAFKLDGSTINEDLHDFDMLWVRHKDEAATQLSLGDGNKLTNVRPIGAIELRYDSIHKNGSGEHHVDVYTWNPLTRPYLKYFVSFPFDVAVNSIFGLNQAKLGTDYIIQGYNGAKRASDGLFLGDGDTYWEYLTKNDTMKAGQGYYVIFDNMYAGGWDGHIWDNKGAGSSVYMYFPATEEIARIDNTNQTSIVPKHTCTIDRAWNNNKDKNHMNTDSHWNTIGSPLFHNSYINGYATAVDTALTSYYYLDNPVYGTQPTWMVQAIKDAPMFKAMSAVLVQWAGTITWTTTETNIFSAPRRKAEDEKNYFIKLDMLMNGELRDWTYLDLKEGAVADFLLNEDMSKVNNRGVPNIYSFAGAYDVAYNTLPIENQTIPVGMIIRKNGTYTFSMPYDFSGTVTLIDTYEQTRTNLAIEDYEVNLNKGTIDDRFLLEININQAPTAIDGVTDGSGSLKDGKVHKFIMNDMLYILKDGVLYDARGARVK